MDKWEQKITKRLTDFYRELNQVKEKSNRKTNDVEVLFATKYLSKERLASFIDIYQKLRREKVIIGENRVQAAENKFNVLGKEDIVKVMIGNLQKNKINKALNLFDEIWGVDNLEVAEELKKRIVTGKMPVFLEINVSGEKSKHGFKSKEADTVIKTIQQFNNLTIRGLMTMAPETDGREIIRAVFRELKQIAVRHNLLTSMGMSGDWREAVMEGSDILRIGSRIFG